MTKRILSYRVFNVVYVMAIALIITILLGGTATHPGLVLGLVTLVFGLQLLTRVLTYGGDASLIHLIVLVAVVVFAIMMVTIGGDARELWVSTWYLLCSIGLLADGALRRNSRLDNF
ncbi:hypothetical protein [Alicyclobacillus sp. ALC3]|uniref:hypothetical protein n=1 Tax=Alicyclobacillus sp. ALC3 TaxID=2796143 RepID=UPI00237A067A|nr:hypothetical protein [Alicyclobacillus sp. ALC3]WDL95321.1 hypothetical protein JC200_12940 [Alicyclobacillus sp. ALC3]